MDPARPLYEQIRARLTEAIARGDWKPGETIPAEGAMARAFGASIGTVRKAVDALVAGQVLVRRQGKGTFVSAHDSRRLLYHFFHVVRRDGHRVHPEVRLVSFRRDRADAECAEALGIARDEKILRIRNLLSLDGSSVVVDDLALPAALFPGLTERIFAARDNTIYHLFQSRFGINVLRADERLGAVAAAGEVARLLGVPPGFPLLEIRRTALTFRDRAVEWRVSRVNTTAHTYHNAFSKGAAF